MTSMVLISDGILLTRGRGANFAPMGGHVDCLCPLCGGLVDRGRANLIGLNLRRSLTYFCQELLHLGIGCAVVNFRVFFVVPQTDSNSFRSVCGYQADFISEALILLKQR